MLTMAITVFDVAQYILQERGRMTTMKLQKLVYYAQAWTLAWTGQPLFVNAIEAWDRGPVVRDLWEVHRGLRYLDVVPQGNAHALDANQREAIEAVLGRYASLSPEVLSELTHGDTPWRTMHNRADTVISHGALQSYYGELGNELFEDESIETTDLFFLKLLLMQVTPDKRPEIIDWGFPVGQETW